MGRRRCLGAGVFTALVIQADADEDVRWAVSVDSVIVGTHQQAG
ncbi:hypothetical protein [Streptomyces mashuensis]|nr:hypothetical protein [Streptomyces mashuensis]